MSPQPPPDIFYVPVVTDREFSGKRRYDQLNVNNFGDIVDAFEERILTWYLGPAKYLRSPKNKGHSGFPVVALCCLLIDALSQFEAGTFASEGQTFKGFIKRRMPTFSGSVQPAIDRPTDGPPPHRLDKIEQVLWNGFRCGILHEAHAPLFCAIDGSLTKGVEIHVNGSTTYSNGSDCPTVVLDPDKFLAATEAAFKAYLSDLKATPADNGLRSKFAKKFARSFGLTIDIS